MPKKLLTQNNILDSICFSTGNMFKNIYIKSSGELSCLEDNFSRSTKKKRFHVIKILWSHDNNRGFLIRDRNV